MYRVIAAGMIVVLGVTGCSTQAQVYSAAVEHAADRWERACGVRPRPASVVLLDVHTFRCGPQAPVAVGCTDAVGHVTLATRADVPADALVLHELGHVLGAGHLTTGVVGIMTREMNSSSWWPCLTQADLDAVGMCIVLHPECDTLHH